MQHDLGMVGLGVMGRNLVLNMCDHGFSVAGLDRDAQKVTTLHAEDKTDRAHGTTDAKAFVASLKKPRRVMMLVPAGPIVDSVIAEMQPLLEPGDMLIDGGNSHYTDTDRRIKALEPTGIHFFGVGISGGELGARFGPSMMPGGDPAAYKAVQPIFEAIAARAGENNDQPCVAYLGRGSAGHYVKMAHNGIEYAVMQLLAETYDLMHRGLGMSNDAMADVFADWNSGELESFLVQITAQVLRQPDDKDTGKSLIDVILDRAKQKGTGKWTSQSAMDLQVPLHTIDMAVASRDISGYKDQRLAAADHLTGPSGRYGGDADDLVVALRHALYFGMVTAYAQGMDLLRMASQEYDYGINPGTVARIWRGGCIIRATVLQDMMNAYGQSGQLMNLLMDKTLGAALVEKQTAIRSVVRAGIDVGIPVPAYAASVAYFDSYRSPRLPANLIQGLRDNFGAHTYERVDREGSFHTMWTDVSTAEGSTAPEQNPGTEKTKHIEGKPTPQ